MDRCKAIAGMARIDAAVIVGGVFMLSMGWPFLGLVLLLFGIKWVIEDVRHIKKHS